MGSGDPTKGKNKIKTHPPQLNNKLNADPSQEIFVVKKNLGYKFLETKFFTRHTVYRHKNFYVNYAQAVGEKE